MKKILSVFMVVVSMISCIFGMTCYASEYEKDELRGNIYENQTSKKFSMVEGETVFINDMPNKLYITFESQSEAIESIKELIPELLLELASQYNLEELNNSNWIQYEDCMYQYREKCNDLSLLNQMDELVSFFDIYENYDKNIEIKALVDEYNVDNTEEIAEKLALLLPYYTTFVKDYFGDIQSARSSFNINAAINYAVKHATDYNYLEYGYLGTRDCTNFVSQILENGGVEQDVNDSVYSGWWHINHGYENQYSRS